MVARSPLATKRYPRCIMGTCCVPWTAAYALDETLMRQCIGEVVEQGTQHVYIFGTAGEGYAVSNRQFQQITRVFVDEMTGRSLEPMVGVISQSLSEALDRIAWCSGLGVSRFQISLPSWGACTEAETVDFFEQVCTRFPSFEFMHYNVKRAGRLLAAEEYGRLVSMFPNLVAAKLAGSTGKDAAAIQRAAPELRLFLTESAFAEAGAMGVNAGLLISYASLSWSVARAFYDAVVSGDAGAVHKHREEQAGVIELLHDCIQSGAHMDGAFDKIFLKKSLPAFPLRLLPPYHGVSDAECERFLTRVAERYPNWMERV